MSETRRLDIQYSVGTSGDHVSTPRIFVCTQSLVPSYHHPATKISNRQFLLGITRNPAELAQGSGPTVAWMGDIAAFGPLVLGRSKQLTSLHVPSTLEGYT